MAKNKPYSNPPRKPENIGNLNEAMTPPRATQPPGVGIKESLRTKNYLGTGMGANQPNKRNPQEAADAAMDEMREENRQGKAYGGKTKMMCGGKAKKKK